ncbi:MAG TPA: hypothetical protein VNJ07_13060 [Chitinophagales bacterium]|nr:hypothetical protein [Chitinophagales bacterium]
MLPSLIFCVVLQAEMMKRAREKINSFIKKFIAYINVLLSSKLISKLGKSEAEISGSSSYPIAISPGLAIPDVTRYKIC